MFNCFLIMWPSDSLSLTNIILLQGTNKGAFTPGPFFFVPNQFAYFPAVVLCLHRSIVKQAKVPSTLPSLPQVCWPRLAEWNSVVIAIATTLTWLLTRCNASWTFGRMNTVLRCWTTDTENSEVCKICRMIWQDHTLSERSSPLKIYFKKLHVENKLCVASKWNW